MPMQEEPIVGTLYEDADGLRFEVIGIDEDLGTVEVQYDDGAVDEIDIDTWYEMELRRLKLDSGRSGDGAEEEEDEDDKKRPGRVDDDDEEEDDEEEDDYYDEV